MFYGCGRRALTSAFCLLTLATASLANAQLINEFQPNPVGTDPNPGMLELLGTPSASFSGVLIARETDDATGNINSVDAVSGTFDANGILAVSIPDFENPSFELILVDAFTGVAGVDTINSMGDLTALGTTVIYDAISVIDTAGDGANAISGSLGGVEIAYTGDEPQVVFRDSSDPSIVIAINDPANTDAFDQNGNMIPLATGFADAGGTPIDISAGPFTTFGAANYQVTAVIDPVGSCSGLSPAPACVETTQSNCTTLGGTFVESGNCPTGACDNTGGCTIETEEDCLNASGTYNGNGSACPLSGSCSGLTPAPACIQTTDVDCTNLGGTFVEDGMCPTGACDNASLCSVETEADCLTAGGTYNGDGTMCPGLMSDIFINEFQPNPPGVDPSPTSFEILGPVGMGFSGFLLAVETDVAGDTGSVQAVFPISGSFDANGILNASIDDLENPSFALFLVDTYTGPTDGTGVLDSGDDLVTLGITTVFDAISISDETGDIANSIAGGIGGLDYPFTGDEPQLVFRDGVDPSIVYAIDDPAGANAQDQFGNTFDLATGFSLVDGTPVDLTVPAPTFGLPNYTTLVADPTGACTDLAGAPACQQLSEADCLTAGGTFNSGETCPTGACNLPDTTCIIATEESCLSQGGTYTGDGTPCIGACCDLLANDCTPNVSEASCDADGGLYLGDNSDCSGGCPTGPMDIVLNEIRLDQGGADGDYIELAGPAGADLSGLQVLVVGDPASGNVDQVIDLVGQSMGLDGIFLIADAGNANLVANDGIDLDIPGFSIENGDNLTFFLVFGFTGSAGDDVDGNDDCLIDTPAPWISELDRVALIVAQNTDLGGESCHYATMPGMGGGGMGCPDCAGDFDASGTRDLGDVAGFVNALLNTGDACADINADTFVDGLDIDGFTQLVIGQAACPGGVEAVDVPSQIVGPDGNFVPAHAFRIENETGAWRQGAFDPAESFDTAGTPNMVPDGACCTDMGCVTTNQFDCADLGGLFRGEMASCMDAGVCDPQGISAAQGGPNTLGLGFIIGPVTVVETVDNDTNTSDDRTFTVQDLSGVNFFPAGTRRGLAIAFDEVANPALGAFVDTLSEGDCVNVSGTTEEIAGGLFLRIDSVDDIQTGQVGCAAITVPTVFSGDFVGGTPESEALSSLRVQLDCAFFRDSGTFGVDTTYPITDGGTADVDVRVNTAAGAAMPIIGTAIPTNATRIEGVYSLAFGPQLLLHESDDLTTTNCGGDFGACCFTDGTCAEVSFQICFSLGGVHNFGLTCGQVTCVPSIGACCTDDVCAEGVTQITCESGGGLYFGDGSTCPAECPNQGSIEISEIRRDQGGTDTDEYIEIAGEPGTPMSSLTYIIIGDTGGSSGVIEEVIDLSGQVIPADGFWVMAEAATLPNIPMVPGGIDLVTAINLENGDNVTHLIVTNFSGSDGADLDADDNCILDSEPWGDVIDLIALIELDNVDAMGNPVGDTGTPVGPGIEPDDDSICHYGPPTVGPDGTFDPAHVYRCNGDPGGPWLIGNFGNFDLDTPGGPNACMAAACCNMGVCTLELEADCTMAGGTFQGMGSDCIIDPCGATGACCDVMAGLCDEVSAITCTNSFPGRTFNGEGTSCVGACCDGVSCSLETEADCMLLGGTFEGVCTECTPNPCGPTGACCDTNTFDCDDDLTTEECTALFPGRTFTAGMTCLDVCSVPSVALVSCFDGVNTNDPACVTDATNNGVCIYSTTGNLVPGAGCDTGSFFGLIQVVCQGSCDPADTITVFEVPAGSLDGTFPPTDCLIEAQLAEFGGNGTGCDTLLGATPLFDLAP